MEHMEVCTRGQEMGSSLSLSSFLRVALSKSLPLRATNSSMLLDPRMETLPLSQGWWEML